MRFGNRSNMSYLVVKTITIKMFTTKQQTKIKYANPNMVIFNLPNVHTTTRRSNPG